MTWGIYARVSTEEQANEGLSIDAQLVALREYFRAKGIPVREFVDRGKSAWTEDLDKRPAFKEMLDQARVGELEGLAVTHLDRFSRKLIVTLQVLGEMGQRGVGFISLENAAFDFSRPADRLLLAVMGAFAEYYSAELSRKIRRGMAQRAGKGLHVGTLPFGYCDGRCPGCDKACERHATIAKDDPPIPHLEDAPGVTLAFETYHLGNQSDGSVASVMNTAGYRSRTRKGRVLWNEHSIDWLLGNPFYCGKVVVKGQVFQGKHEPLISEQLFNEVQAMRRQRLHRSNTYSPKYRVYLFAGIMVCSGCGRNMRALSYGGPHNSYRGYRCTAVESNKIMCDKPQRPIHADLLEEQFGAIVRQFRLPTDWRERVNQMLTQNGRRVNAESERKNLQAKLERLNFMFKEGGLERDAYSKELADIKAHLAELVPPQEREILDAGAYLENLAAIWDAATIGEQRQIVLATLQRVVCDPEGKRLVALKPKPAFIPLFRQASQLREREGVFELGC
ncbi:MAG: recombinase family protein [Anaerolineae bacterium]